MSKDKSDQSGTEEVSGDGLQAEEQTEESSEEDFQGAEVELARLQEELENARDQSLRVQAEMQNLRRRAERDVGNAHKYALERFVGELLPVVDNLERAIEAIDREEEHGQKLLEGVELTLKSFIDTLKRFNVEPVDPLNQPFNPEFHQAMTTVEDADAAPNTVLNVFQKGYTLNGRLVRPAMVIVSRAPDKK